MAAKFTFNKEEENDQLLDDEDWWESLGFTDMDILIFFTDWWKSSEFTNIDTLIFFRRPKLIRQCQREKGNTRLPDESKGFDSLYADRGNGPITFRLSLAPVDVNVTVSGPGTYSITETPDNDFLLTNPESGPVQIEIQNASIVEASSSSPNTDDRYKAYPATPATIPKHYNPVTRIVVPMENRQNRERWFCVLCRNVEKSWRWVNQHIACCIMLFLGIPQ